jgi:ribosomal protein S18 acetylase RimI-like enzyme
MMCMNCEDSAFELRIRPLRRDDGRTLDTVFAGLSEHSRYLRFHTPTPRLTATMRQALLDVDGARRLALVAELCLRGLGDCWEPIGIARLVRTGGAEAEIAIAVTDAWQHRGVGRRLLTELRADAERLGIRSVHALVLPENVAALAAVEAVFPVGLRQWDGGAIRLVAPLRPDADWAPTTEEIFAALSR